MNKMIFVFAGPNGSGKSSVINDYLNAGICPLPYICPDEIVKKARKLDSQKSDYELYIGAMNLAADIRNQYVIHEQSFTFETVFSNMEKLKFLRFAKAYGFHINVIYVTTSDPSINIKRVRRRVSEGGHDVPEDKIRTRYERSMELMAEVVAFADEAEVYDNSVDEAAPLQVFKKYPDGTMFAKDHVSWVIHYLCESLTDMGYVLSKLPE